VQLILERQEPLPVQPGADTARRLPSPGVSAAIAAQGGRPQAAPKIGPWKLVIETWLEADKKAPRKLRYSPRRIWQGMREEHNADLSEAIVRRFVAEVRARQELADMLGRLVENTAPRLLEVFGVDVSAAASLVMPRHKASRAATALPFCGAAARTSR
jgi:hypothetical protein